MSQHFAKLGLTVLFGILAALLPLSAAVAEDTPIPISPITIEPDINGVNLATGKITPHRLVLSVPAAPRLKFDQVQNAAPFISGNENRNFDDGGDVSGKWTVHTMDGTSESFDCQFTVDGKICTSVNGSGSALTYSGRYFQKSGSGEIYNFSNTHLFTTPAPSDPYPKWQRLFYVSTITYTDGEVISFSYDTAALPAGQDPYGRIWYRPTRITSSLGYYIEIHYRGSTLGEPAWGQPSDAALYKTGNATPLQQLTYNSNGSVTDITGRVFAGLDAGELGLPTESAQVTTTLPGESTPALNIQPVDPTAAFKIIGSVSADGASYTYTYGNAQFAALLGEYTYSYVDVTGPESYHAHYAIKLAGGIKSIGLQNRVETFTDSLGHNTGYEYDVYGRLTKVTSPELNSVAIQYDAAGNIERKTSTPKPSSPLSALVEQQFVDLTGFAGPDDTVDCYNHIMCWRPTWRKDAKLHQTDFAYNAYGQLTDQLEPADSAGVRRRTHIDYTATGPRRKSAEYICGGTLTSCSTAIASRTEYTYWGDTALPLTVRQIDPATGAYLETTYTYDDAGRVLSADGPLPGTDDATYFRYDTLGRKTWEIGPKGEAGFRQATVTTYRSSDDKPVTVKSGRVSSPSDPNLTLFSQADTSYDGRRNPSRVAISSGGTTYQVTDSSYDLRNRPVCTAIRMNPAAFGSLPTDACALGTSGTQGPDRITKNIYNSAGQLTKVQKAYLTSLQQDYATYEYTQNGKMKAMIDARGYRAEMTWDGFDRQSRWYFPSSASTGLANPGDYEEYGYDANGNRTSLRKRDGSLLSYTYDNLNRMITKVVPTRSGLSTTHTRDVAYTYDLRNLPLTSTFSEGAAGEGVSIGYDAYGRPTTTSFTMDGVTRTLTSGFDVAGNRTSLTFPDNQTFSWQYLSGGQFNQLKDPAGNILVDYAYDDHDRLSGAARYGAAHDETWGYDALSRLSSLAITNSGSSQDSTWTFSRNAAAQLSSQSRTNDSYAWAGTSPTSLNYTANGLNQYSQVGASGFCYDANGNLTADGTKVYLYDDENRLVEMRARVGGTCPATYSGIIMATLRYDPLGRLYEITNYINGISQGATRFLYDEDALVAEYSVSGALLQRHIHGPAAASDDPLIDYSGSSVALATARFLSSDVRGSVVLSTNSAGTSPIINTYDDWGVNGANNSGRFQYTGQAWLPELGMYYYKARMYSPTLGRFMQTDPIGYADQINLYVYVSNDPNNSTDPKGLCKNPSESRLCADLEKRISRALTRLEDEKKKIRAQVEKAARDGDQKLSDQLTTRYRALAAAEEQARAGIMRIADRSGVSGAFRSVNGDELIGFSWGSGGKGDDDSDLHPIVTSFLNELPSELRGEYHGACCEVHILSDAVRDGIKIGGSYLETIRSETGKVVEKCDTCQALYNYLKENF